MHADVSLSTDLDLGFHFFKISASSLWINPKICIMVYQDYIKTSLEAKLRIDS